MNNTSILKNYAKKILFVFIFIAKKLSKTLYVTYKMLYSVSIYLFLLEEFHTLNSIHYAHSIENKEIYFLCPTKEEDEANAEKKNKYVLYIIFKCTGLDENII